MELEKAGEEGNRTLHHLESISRPARSIAPVSLPAGQQQVNASVCLLVADVH